MVRFCTLSTLDHDAEALLRQRAEAADRDPELSVQQIGSALADGRLCAVSLYDDDDEPHGLAAWRWVDVEHRHAQVILHYMRADAAPALGAALVDFVFSELLRERSLAVIEARLRDDAPGLRDGWLRRDAVFFERCRMQRRFGVLPLPVLPGLAAYHVERWEDEHQAAIEALAVEARRGTIDEVVLPELEGKRAGEMLRLRRAGGYGGTLAWNAEASLVALDRRGRVVGYCAAGLDGEMGQIIDLGVHSSHRQHGLGLLLLARSLTAFQRQQASGVTLGVTTRNPARQLCNRLGFQAVDCGEVAIWWRDGRQTEWRV